ncbi:MipA/OmpV family protein [Duganella qianjiadongensis]|uniref:MipA/OmpV family protein n=1 Tax=Duganella qianjiadongensis TaxID=2692176 RepID=A0ABW9VGA6_9BURK|nr:MipA/OmpV family protein [Duganella qianjiadongensis]MYM38056.1 MipA/OmpV family protein [Duganella qianjiadongensis]
MKPVATTFAALCALSALNIPCYADPLAASDPEQNPASSSADSMHLGVGLAYVPEYAGGKKSRVVPLPIFERTFSNGFFISSTRGLGYQMAKDNLQLSAALSYGGARADHKRNIFEGSDALKGMGDIDGAAQAVFNASYRFDAISVSLGTTQNLGQRSHGNTYTLGSSLQLMNTASDQLGLGISAEYGDHKHVQTYFGVTPRQSMYSGYNTFLTKAGFTSVGAAVNWNHVIDKQWSVHTVAGFRTLTGDAADSPLSKRRTAPLLMTGLIYSF